MPSVLVHPLVPLLFWTIVLGSVVGAVVYLFRSTKRARTTGDSGEVVAERPGHFRQIAVRFLEVDGWTIRYHQSGRGPHLVLLHGLGANLFCWRWIIPLLNTHFTVTALDLPGFGQSSKRIDATYGLDEQAHRVDAILNQLNIDATYMVGNSMGGNIALALALRFSGRVKSLALIAPASATWLVPLPVARLAWLATPASYLLTRQAVRWSHARTVSRRERLENDRIEESFATYGRKADAVRSFLLATAAIRDQSLIRDLKDFTKPVLILWGSRDRLVSRKVIDGLEAALPKAQSYVHLGGGHHLQEDEPEWVAEKLTSFFI